MAERFVIVVRIARLGWTRRPETENIDETPFAIQPLTQIVKSNRFSILW